MGRRTATGVLAAALLASGASSGAAQGGWELIVSSRNDDSVKRYDGTTGAYLGDLVPPRGAGLIAPQEVVLRGEGELLVVGRGNDAVLRFDLRTGEPLGAFTSGYALDNPTKADWGPDGHLYVSQWGQARSSVAVFDGASGAFLREATPDLNQPMEHLWDADGNLLVVSFGSRDVRRFGPDGARLDPLVPAGAHLQGPTNMWWDAEGALLVADWQSGTIQRFDAGDGRHLGAWATGISNPEGWALGPDGALYVGEWTADRIRRVDPLTGALRDVFAEGGGLLAPNGILFVERPRR